MDYPSRRDCRAKAWHDTGWRDALGSAAAALIAGVVSVTALPDAAKTAWAVVIGLGSGAFVLGVQYVVHRCRAPGAILLERGTAIERERDAARNVISAAEVGRSEAYSVMARLHAIGAEMLVRHITSQEGFDLWLAGIMNLRHWYETELRPQLKDHEWAKVFGYYRIPGDQRFGHEFSLEHRQHLLYLHAQVEYLVELMARYATAPPGVGPGSSSRASPPSSQCDP